MGRQTKVCLELAKRKLNDFLFFSSPAHFWSCWVSLAVQALGFSLWWFFSLQSTDCSHTGFGGCSKWTQSFWCASLVAARYVGSSGTMADCRKNNLCSPWPSAVCVLSLWVSFCRTFHRNAIIPRVLCVWTCSYVSGSCNSARVLKTFVATHFSACDLHSIERTDHIWYIPHLLMIIWTASSY